MFFDTSDEASFTQSFEQFHARISDGAYDPACIQNHAQTFSQHVFLTRIEDVIQQNT